MTACNGAKQHVEQLRGIATAGDLSDGRKVRTPRRTIASVATTNSKAQILHVVRWTASYNYAIC